MSGWPGFFISFEGIDGVGKSTQVAALAGSLSAGGHEVITVRPNDTEVGELIRGYVLRHHIEPIDAWVEALLFNAGRVQLLRETILPALDRGAVVIADRFADSTLAYQGGGRGVPLDALRTLHRKACQDIWPDLTILLDMPHDQAAQRQRSQQLAFDRIEAAPDGFHAAVQATFNDLARAEPQRFVRVDASRQPVTISREIQAVAEGRIAEARGRVSGAAS